MDAQTLTLHRFTLGYLQRLAADVADADLARQFHPGQNHPAWLLGHLAVTADFGLHLLGGAPRVPRAWRPLFGPGSQPAAQRGLYPGQAELLSAVGAGFAALVEQAAGATPEKLAGDHGFEPLKAALPTVGDMLAHLLVTHLMLHTAQLSQWRRNYGLPPLF